MRNIKLSLLLILVFGLAGCGKKPSATGIYLSELFKDKTYKKFDTAVFNAAVQFELKQQRGKLFNQKVLKRFFEEKSKSDTAWFITLIKDHQIDSLESFFNQSYKHGIAPELFNAKKIDSLKQRFNQGKFDSLRQLYTLMARFQVLTANAYISYASKMQYGCIDPSKIYARYYIPVERPTDSSLFKMLSKQNWVDQLNAIQPKRAEYIFLQKALDTCSDIALRAKILLNMERYRWKIPADSGRFVRVNIPSFNLVVVDTGKVQLTMKVCVGEKREDDYAAKKEIYLKSKLVEDKPLNHETPIMFGKLNNIQLNPKWNIPHSIAQTEILAKSRANPYYLVSSGIRVYNKKGETVDPTEIDWDSVNPNNIPYNFKQDPGDGNALGKFKFNFPNKSSIYLHDTPNKSAFKKDNRAVSHGCIRVADPLTFAKVLIQSPRLFDEIRIETGLPPLDTLKMGRYERKLEHQQAVGRQTRWITIQNSWPLFIDYYTCVPDSNGVKVYNDVYDYDNMLLDSLKRYLVKSNQNSVKQ
ncbi:L,D-transpeptidase family protein [Solitalea sp. MAHUQ-68]|uniref:L,D-transpeptidase family protein n=2 Tax=Sphingobacteriaceae TaxID=84566 RepID=A0A9X2F3T6_9SPHI|nr:L,D-transpeptidase family protein [Solitalea agri]